MKHFSVLFSIAFIFSLFLTDCKNGKTGGEKEPNNTIGEANKAVPQESFPISINPKADVDWFKMELPGQGYLKVQAGETPGNLELEVSFARYQEWEGEKEKRIRGWNRLPDAVFIPEKGTWYFAVKDNYDDAYSKETVDIRASFLKEFDNHEPNDTPEDAAVVEPGEIINPAVYPKKDQDWFQVHVKEQGYLSVQSNHVPEGIKPEVLFAVYDPWAEPKKQEIRSWHGLPDACFVPDSGNYLIKLHDDYDDGCAESTFDLKVNFIKEMDQGEPNDHFEDAKMVSRGDTLDVAIFPQEDMDYFKLENTRAGELKIAAKGFSGVVPEARLFIMDENNPEELEEVSNWKGLPATFETKVDETYFLLVHDDYDDQGSSTPFQLLIE